MITLLSRKLKEKYFLIFLQEKVAHKTPCLSVTQSNALSKFPNEHIFLFFLSANLTSG